MKFGTLILSSIALSSTEVSAFSPYGLKSKNRFAVNRNIGSRTISTILFATEEEVTGVKKTKKELELEAIELNIATTEAKRKALQEQLEAADAERKRLQEKAEKTAAKPEPLNLDLPFEAVTGAVTAAVGIIGVRSALEAREKVVEEKKREEERRKAEEEARQREAAAKKRTTVRIFLCF